LRPPHRVASAREVLPARPAQDRPYTAPHDVKVLDLAPLLTGVRTHVPEQQARLEFEADRLWCAGDVSLVQRQAVAIVGTRNVSPEGAARARCLGRELADAGIVVVSGLARGVDTEALTAAIDAGGKVIAVIGTPLDKAYPSENKRLQETIYRHHLLISPFETGRRVFQSNFPERNRLMATIADATAIIEASEGSGTLHQAAECVRIHRWLFIARSLMDDPTVHWLDRYRNETTVRALTDANDILSVLPSRK
jgi:DNA processing protein